MCDICQCVTSVRVDVAQVSKGQHVDCHEMNDAQMIIALCDCSLSSFIATTFESLNPFSISTVLMTIVVVVVVIVTVVLIEV